MDAQMEKDFIKGGAFLIENRTAAEIFTPEDFTDEHKMIGETIREFVDNEVHPVIPEMEKHNWQIARDLVKAAGDLGLLGANIPEEYGGAALDQTSGVIIAEAVGRGEYEQGLLVCGSGTGMAITANKVRGVRAAVAWNEEIARLARQHNNANVLSIGARVTPEADIPNIVKAWFAADFEGGRHEGRVKKISDVENDDLN